MKFAHIAKNPIIVIIDKPNKQNKSENIFLVESEVKSLVMNSVQ
ncbi:MAG: hypothetical protein ACRDFB_08230 [Rhabdochlamydiaceae bacterium]